MIAETLKLQKRIIYEWVDWDPGTLGADGALEGTECTFHMG